MNLFARPLTGLVVALVVLAACGGGGGGAASSTGSSSSASSTGSGTESGRAAVSVAWPSRDRDVPLAANSARVAILQSGKTLQTEVAVRPSDGGASVVSFSNLPLGTVDVQVSVYASTDGTGTALSTGASTLATVAGTPMPATVAMDPVVAMLTPSATTLSVAKGGTATLGLTALDAASDTVAVPTDGLQWTSDAPSIATVAAGASTATVTGVGVGSTTIRATLTRADGTTVSMSASVTVSGNGGTVTVH